MNKYESIINLPHHVSKTRKPMSMEARASQFAPFSALTGYEDAIKEKGRLTDKELGSNEELEGILNKKLYILENSIKLKPEITVTYFLKDLKKEGGSYLTETFNLRRIDKVNQELIMTCNKRIKFSNIINIKSELFKNI